MPELTQTLYVEDEPDIRELVQIALEDEGFELTVCTDGAEALQRAETLHPDLVILDVMMPGMDGPTALAKLRQLPHMQTTPVIFMTAKVQPNEVEQYKSLGALDVIVKPFDAMTLADQIHGIVEGQHA